ncbi:LytR family transcriptional regulator [Flavobacterium beibuense F44-8]|uniref:LytR family transcriptional regulator n=1 Tax=Flavobacterium beibuense F44-8 TaxID=1406840 RepID=A0A0A2LGA6_9FLAO|nr:LytTR family DNA-binding domain-containing protein [Flavobacterium beibuense]KGO79177.1 LytR family transcriptional regulator [Flavobacterium beibuense F44-8]
MNSIIIDDETLARTIISQMATKDPELNVTGEFSSAIQAMKFLNEEETKPDLIFLDIHMPDFTGFDFIKTIKNPPAVILVTSDKNFAIEAFEYDCIVDYLVKPITEERFLKAVKKAKAKKDETPATVSVSASTDEKQPTDTANEFYVNIDRRLIKIDIPTINIVEAKGDYIQIKTETKNYTVHSTLKKIEEKLPSSLFLKVHRTYIINTKKIIDIEDNSVLIGKDVVPVSRANRPELMKRLNML